MVELSLATSLLTTIFPPSRYNTGLYDEPATPISKLFAKTLPLPKMNTLPLLI